MAGDERGGEKGSERKKRRGKRGNLVKIRGKIK
jgi:hypothetical protein